MAKSTLQNDEITLLIEDLASFSGDPLGFVYYAFPWGQGELEKFSGPDDWAIEILKAVRDGLITIDEAIRIAVSSGHGIGKSALVSWLILWAISTFEDTKGIVTASTEGQLTTKTWPELAKWHRLFIAKDLFELKSTSIYSKDPEHEKTWRIDAIPWSAHNSEAFAGLHNQGKRIVIIFDEASSIDDLIWEVIEGALSDKDTEIIWAAFGNPTRTVGRFRECGRKYKHRWKYLQVDSRTVKITNKTQIQEWIDDYGVDSDFVKVRVRGIAPNTSDKQFIPTQFIDQARGRHVGTEKYDFAPKIMSVDPSYSGEDEFVIGLRQGLAFKVLATYRKIEDDLLAAGYIAALEDEHKCDAVFIDFGMGTGIQSAGKYMGRKWVLVAFGGESSDHGFLNKRAEMWNSAKTWLKDGGCLPDDQLLCDELGAPEFRVKLNGKVVLESKEEMKSRGIPSPNRADALVLTFAFPVRKKELAQFHRQEFANQDYDPLA